MRHEKIGKEILPSEAWLADRIRPENNADAYSDFTVVKITKEAVTLMRPYVHTADFSMSGGKGPGSSSVIGYTGLETWSVWIDDSRPLGTLLHREELK